MINKSQFESLENELDVYAKKRQLNSDLAKQYKAVVKALDSEIKSLRTKVENFDAIKSLKGDQ